ncbi:hypothetical protein Bbelb_268570 [Branchiostoma belcheri]|nr:hypothetical protein Bbelb_268570 [Branchiostoma belcheri]
MRPPLKIILQILLKLSLLRTVVTSGCSSSSPLGMETGTIQDNQLSAFSSHPRFGPVNARLNNNSEWRADANNQSQWLQVDLRKTTVLTGIQTQGQRTGRDRFVTSFEVSYFDDGTDWTVFTGNSDQNQYHLYNALYGYDLWVILVQRITPQRNATNVEVTTTPQGKKVKATTIPTTVFTTSTIKTTSQPVVSTTSNTRTTQSPPASTSTTRKTPDQALVTTTVIVNTTREKSKMSGSRRTYRTLPLDVPHSPAERIALSRRTSRTLPREVPHSVLHSPAERPSKIDARGRNGSQKEPSNEEGEGTVDNIIYDSATFSANGDDGGVSFGQSDGFVDNSLYAEVRESPTTEVQNQTSQKNDQTPLYATVNKSQDEGFVDNDLYSSVDTQNRDC